MTHKLEDPIPFIDNGELVGWVVKSYPSGFFIFDLDFIFIEYAFLPKQKEYTTVMCDTRFDTFAYKGTRDNYIETIEKEFGSIKNFINMLKNKGKKK